MSCCKISAKCLNLFTQARSVLELVNFPRQFFRCSPLWWSPTEYTQARQSNPQFLSLNTDDQTRLTGHHGSEFANLPRITIVGMVLDSELCVNLTCAFDSGSVGGAGFSSLCYQLRLPKRDLGRWYDCMLRLRQSTTGLMYFGTPHYRLSRRE